MLRLAFDFIITWRETRTRPNAYVFSFKIVDKLKTIPIFAYRLTTLKSKYYGENRQS